MHIFAILQNTLFSSLKCDSKNDLHQRDIRNNLKVDWKYFPFLNIYPFRIGIYFFHVLVFFVIISKSRLAVKFCPLYDDCVETESLKRIWITSPSLQQPPSSWHHQVPRKFTLDYKANDQNNADHGSNSQWCVLTSFCLEKLNYEN